MLMKHKTLSGEAEISAYLHRTRMDILKSLREGPATGSQIAARMRTHPANLTRHIRILQDAGLIRLSYTRDTGRNVEKYYEAVAHSYDVAPEAGHLTSPHKTALAFARSDLSAAIAQLSDSDRSPVLVLLSEARISRASFDTFAQRLQEVVTSFSKADQADGDAYHITLGLYPGDYEADTSAIRLVARDERSEE